MNYPNPKYTLTQPNLQFFKYGIIYDIITSFNCLNMAIKTFKFVWKLCMCAIFQHGIMISGFDTSLVRKVYLNFCINMKYVPTFEILPTRYFRYIQYI